MTSANSSSATSRSASGVSSPDIAIGIDLGTTYSCVAVWNPATDKVDIIANDQGQRTTPSYVAFTETERLIGISAKNQVAMNAENTIFDAKRLIGRKFGDKEVQKDMTHWPFHVTSGHMGNPVIEVNYKGEPKQFKPEEISAMVLVKMKETAETHLGHPVSKAVITVPAYFNDAQRQATTDAATIAGLNCLRIINEPTAAAIAYGIDQGNQAEHNILVFDFGGGTFDVSVLNLEDGVYTVKATNGDTHLGGEDIDNLIVDYCVKDFQTKHGQDLNINPRALRRLRTYAERAKQTLSSSTETKIEIDSLFNGIDYEITLTRARLEHLCANLFKSCMIPVEKVLTDAKLGKGDIQEVVLVGGSTRIPKIQSLLREFFHNKELNKKINPDEAVAYGAAVQAFILNGGKSKVTNPILLIDVNPLSLGIETAGQIMTKIIPRNTTKPTQKSQIFTTGVDNQPAVTIKIYEGEREFTKDNRLLGTFDLDEIPPARRGVPQIEVTFDLDANGILNVMAENKATKKGAKKIINNDRPTLSQAEIERMLAEAEKFKDDDQKQKAKLEARMGLESLLTRIQASWEEEQLKSKVTETELTQIKTKCESVRTWLDQNLEATTPEYEQQHKDLETANNQLMTKVYQNGGDMDKSQFFQPPPSEASTTKGPKVEEVD